MTAPDKPQNIITAPDRPQNIMTSPDRTHNIMTAPDRPQNIMTAPDRPQNIMTAPDRPHNIMTAPDRPQNIMTAPDRPHNIMTAPDRPQNIIMFQFWILYYTHLHFLKEMSFLYTEGIKQTIPTKEFECGRISIFASRQGQCALLAIPNSLRDLIFGIKISSIYLNVEQVKMYTLQTVAKLFHDMLTIY
jgi:hypothetical protein